MLHYEVDPPHPSFYSFYHHQPVPYGLFHQQSFNGRGNTKTRTVHMERAGGDNIIYAEGTPKQGTPVVETLSRKFVSCCWPIREAFPVPCANTFFQDPPLV